MADLDRVVTLVVVTFTRDGQGNSVETETEHTVWAEQRNATAGNLFSTGAIVRTLYDRVYRIRYRADAAETVVGGIRILDEQGQRFNASRIDEVDRRRYLDIACTRAA